MFKLYANNTLLEECSTRKECKECQKEYKQIEKAMFGKKDIKYKIVED